jgi:hypothetical protein
MDNLIFQFVVFALLFSVGFGFGRYYERKHLKELAEQEVRLAHIVLDTHRFTTSEFEGQLISSNVVISHDYFKYVIANIQNILGGRLVSYESIVITLEYYRTGHARWNGGSLCLWHCH